MDLYDKCLDAAGETYLRAVLVSTVGNLRVAARMMGCDRKKVHRLVDRFDLWDLVRKLRREGERAIPPISPREFLDGLPSPTRKTARS